MDTVPKLLPMWHDVALQDFVRRHGTFYRTHYPPNYGGLGTDINVNTDFGNPASSKKQMTFAANTCALPFLPLKKVYNLEDPCLGALKREKLEFDKFCLKLTYVRKSVKRCKRWSSIKTLQQYLNKCRENNRNVESNIEAPQSLINLAENLPKHAFIPKFNVAYAGGALGICKSADILNLLHPVTGTQNKLCITPLQYDSEHNLQPVYPDKNTVNLAKGPILQIEPGINDFCCVRQKNSFHLVNMADMNIFTKRVHQHPLYHVAISPYNPTEILSVYENGIMKLINIESRKTETISENVLEYSSQIYSSWRCGFGSHVFCALCMNEKKVYSIDFREKNCMKKDIFCIENPSCHLDEELVAMKQWKQNPYQHLLTSSHHLIICDERYPKKPVLYWNHTLKHPPIYLECSDVDSNISCIVIGTQDTQELASFLFSHDTNIHPSSLSSPLLLSSPTDCIESLRLHSYYVSDKIFSRLSNPLSGVCVISSEKDTAFTVIQSTSLGDVFYQTFKESECTEKTYKVSTGCTLTPPEKIMPHLKSLMSSSNSEVLEDIDETIPLLQINIAKFLSPPKEISLNCTVCRLRNSSDENELVSSEICPSCNLNSAESQHYSQSEVNSSAVIGPSSEESSYLDCDIDYLSRFEDIYSKRILSVWLESDDFEDRQTSYDQSMVLG